MGLFYWGLKIISDNSWKRVANNYICDMEFTNWSKDEVSRYVFILQRRLRDIRNGYTLDPLGIDYESIKACLLYQYIESRVDEALYACVIRKPLLSRSEGTLNVFRIGRPYNRDNAQNGAKIDTNRSESHG